MTYFIRNNQSIVLHTQVTDSLQFFLRKDFADWIMSATFVNDPPNNFTFPRTYGEFNTCEDLADFDSGPAQTWYSLSS